MRTLGIVAGIVVAVIVVAVVAVIALFNPNQYRGTIQSQLQQKLGRQVSLGEMSLGLFPPRFQVQNISIADDPSFRSPRPFLQAQRLDVSPRLMPLLHKSVEIDSLAIERPSVELIKNAQGVWNFSTLGAAKAPNQPKQTGRSFSLANLGIKDGQVAIIDQQARHPRSVYDHIDLTLADFAEDQPFSLDASVHFPGQGAQEMRLQGKGGPLVQKDPAATPFHGALDLKQVGIGDFQKFLQSSALQDTDGVLSGHTTIASEAGRMSASGQMNLEKPRIHGIDVGYPIQADYDVNQDLATGVLKIAKGNLKLGATPLFISGSLNSKPTPALLDLNLKANDVSITELARLAAAAGIAFAPGATVTGRVNADINARGSAAKPALSGTLNGRDIQASGKDIPQPVQVKAVNLTLTPAEVRSDNFAMTSGATTVNTQFAVRQYTSPAPQVDATLRAPQAELPALLAMAKAYGVTGLDKITGAGTLALDLHATGPLNKLTSDDLIRALNGTLNLNFNNVRYSGVDISHQLASIAGFLKPGQKDNGYTNILKMTGNVLVKNGIAQSNNLQALLDIANVGITGNANLVSKAMNLDVTAVLNKNFSQQVGGTGVGGYLNTALANSQGEIVVPALVTGTFDRPVFAPNLNKIAQMKLKGLMPSADNPLGGGAGLLNSLLGQKTAPAKPGQTPAQKPNAVDQIMGILGGKKQKQ